MTRHIFFIEGLLLGLFMVSACAFGTMLEHPDSPVRGTIDSPFARRALMGVAMGLTALCLVYSPWGRRSGPHINPAVTLCFLRLGRIAPRDAGCFVVAQFIGGAIGVMVMHLLMMAYLQHPGVNYVATRPGSSVAWAWVAEFVITFVLMNVVLTTNRIPRLASFTGCFTALLVAIYITVEAPISGMSMNPARSTASAIFAGTFSSLWIYFTAPPLGMLLAVELHRWLRADASRICGKLAHDDTCVFKCNCLPPRRIETGNPP